jgi:CDP-glucose 4,6-dehydratase
VEIWQGPLEGVVMDSAFWHGKKVFITGHTGFKGSWLCLWLHKLGAEVTGYALNPPTTPSLFELCNISELVISVIADIREKDKLAEAMLKARPEIVIHMAAQPLVRDSFKNPVETYEVNVMGTVNLFEAVRRCKHVKVVINVTTDKCYENKEWIWGYRENEPLGGYDPYSNSKACSELVTAAYRSSFFNPGDYANHGVAIASARAGNVIGGGDWAADRLIPDFLRAIDAGEILMIRSPQAIRPWQHVLEPLSGYLALAERLFTQGAQFAEAWNFGPDNEDARSVDWIIEQLAEMSNDVRWECNTSPEPHEAYCLKLDSSKARSCLGWRPRWNLPHALEATLVWHRAWKSGADMAEFSLRQIREYEAAVVE